MKTRRLIFVVHAIWIIASTVFVANASKPRTTFVAIVAGAPIMETHAENNGNLPGWVNVVHADTTGGQPAHFVLAAGDCVSICVGSTDLAVRYFSAPPWLQLGEEPVERASEVPPRSAAEINWGIHAPVAYWPETPDGIAAYRQVLFVPRTFVLLEQNGSVPIQWETRSRFVQIVTVAPVPAVGPFRVDELKLTIPNDAASGAEARLVFAVHAEQTTVLLPVKIVVA
ncbi:MAG: hypothetical protein LBJ38_01610 [Oscillospiraceae bacterium]|jgi:hypothetical protein|nr:hypothetical protein [Oscillospiraceae bacterium]